jgi:hypothetical protein
MTRLLPIFLLFASAASHSAPWFAGTPDYADEQSRRLATELLRAHGGMEPMEAAKGVQFNFFTKASGNPNPFFSFESVDLSTGNGYIDWPDWHARVALKDGELWSHQWQLPMPAGFFIRLTTSFVTMPWLIRADSANVGPVSEGRLPNDETVYNVLHITFDERSPTIPGTFYDLYIDPETGLLKGIRFDINHPGMVANPNQPLGPNFHVFNEYRQFAGLILPTTYVSYSRGSANGGTSNASHFLWNVRLDEPFDITKLTAPDGAVRDTVSMDWWQTNKHNELASIVAVDSLAADLTGGTQ